MKAKTFNVNVAYAEQQINEWLKQRPKRFRIRQMTQTQNSNYLTIIVIYTE